MLKDCSEDVIQAALDAEFRVHSELGPGLLESVYERALLMELDAGPTAQAQVPVSVSYRGNDLGMGFSGGHRGKRVSAVGAEMRRGDGSTARGPDRDLSEAPWFQTRVLDQLQHPADAQRYPKNIGLMVFSVPSVFSVVKAFVFGS